MKKNEIIEKVKEIFVEEFEVEETVIEPDNNLKASLGLDSLDYVDLVVSIQNVFGVKLVEADFAEIVTFEDFYTVLQNKIASNL